MEDKNEQYSRYYDSSSEEVIVFGYFECQTLNQF